MTLASVGPLPAIVPDRLRPFGPAGPLRPDDREVR